MLGPQAPTSVPFQRQVKSYTRRGGRISDRLQQIVDENQDRLVLDLEREESVLSVVKAPDLEKAFGRQAPLVVEIGAGSGDQIVSRALECPDVNFLALDVWWPGIAQMMSKIVKADLDNVRIAYVDAVDALPIFFGPNEKPVEVWTFFPDPWPKAKHKKRRLVTKEFGDVVASILAPGGTWRLATDWADYAWQMRDEVAKVEGLTNPYAGQNEDPEDPADAGLTGGFAPRWEGRALTRFEKRGINEGRTIRDIMAVSNA